jgi:HAD superfamily hydrolase (TIGR01509 family)
MIKAIFLDFNGVVIDDEPLQLLAYQEVLQAEGITLTEEEYYSSLGMNDMRFVRSVFEREKRELSDNELQHIVDAKSAAHHKLIEKDLPLFPGVVTFIKAASRCYSLGIVSMARLIEIDGVLTRAKLKDLFAVIVSAENVETCKPDSACYVSGMSLLNDQRRKEGKHEVSSNECLAIEDAPPGIESARAAGMCTLGVTNTVSAEALRAAGADVVTRSLFDWTLDAVRHVFDK